MGNVSLKVLEFFVQKWVQTLSTSKEYVCKYQGGLVSFLFGY